MARKTSGLRVMNSKRSFLSDLSQFDVDEVDVCIRRSVQAR